MNLSFIVLIIVLEIYIIVFGFIIQKFNLFINILQNKDELKFYIDQKELIYNLKNTNSENIQYITGRLKKCHPGQHYFKIEYIVDPRVNCLTLTIENPNLNTILN